jgi:DNA-directed DNA polymerase III PolC
MSDFCHLHCHSEFSPLDGLSTTKEMVAQAVADGQTAMAITDHGNCAGHPDFQIACDAAGIKPIFGCLMPGQPLMTDQGPRLIEDIKAGDMVLTHRGRFRPVIRPMSHHYRGNLYTLHAGHMGATEITLTDEHPVLIADRDGNRQWVRADELTGGHRTPSGVGIKSWAQYVCMPRLAEATPQFLDADVLIASAGLRREAGKIYSDRMSRNRDGSIPDRGWDFPEKVELTERLAYFLGLWVAEGGFTAADKGSVWATFHIDEAETLAASMTAYLREEWGITARVYTRADHSTVDVMFTHRPLAALLQSLVGGKQPERAIPRVVFESPQAVRQEFLRGLIDGDGKHSEDGTRNLKTSSKALAWGARQLLADAGYYTKVVAGVERSQFPFWAISYKPTRSWSRTWSDDEYVYIPLHQVTVEQGDLDVYNCEVEEDNSYVSDFALHNCEAYFVDNRFARGEDGKKITHYWHLILWAMDDEGLKNLWAMSTESYRDGLWGKYARLDWDTLQRLNKGVMCSTACLGGPVLNPYIKGDEDLAISNLLRLQEIFGDRLYAEVQTGLQPDQVRGNYWLLNQAHKYGIEPVVTGDCHYAKPGDKEAHKVWLASAIGKTLDEMADSSMFEGDEDYDIATGEVMRNGIESSYNVGEGLSTNYVEDPPELWERALSNTKVIADRCTAHIELTSRNPVYSRATPEHPDPEQHDRELLWQMCMDNWDRRTAGKKQPQSVYMARLEKELGLIFPKGFPGYFLIVAEIVAAAKKAGILVGPGRGSGGGSLVAYLISITELDPVEHDVLFERFMTKGRTELPDFDIDFPSSKKDWVFDWVAKRWKPDHVATVGTHMRLKSKSVIQSVARAIKGSLPEDHWSDIVACSKIIDAAEGDTAGLGLSWEDLWDRAGEELQPYADKYPRLFEFAAKFHGRLKSYGKHPAGVIIDTDRPLTENLPLRLAEGGTMIAQFDLKVLELLGYVKFDFLNISNLDMIQKAVDLVRERTGKVIDPYVWTEELEDPYLYEQIGEGHTLGLFQIGTNSGTALARRMKPKNLYEMTDMITLVRPGPARSGLTDTYLARRKGEQDVSYADPRMEEVLGKSWGAMIYQEQLMKLCMVLANYDDVEADKVRKILGKKKVDEARKQGAIFIERAMANGTDETVTRDLWAQMEEFARYSFGYAHALAYAILAMWTAFLKFHYPLYFFCGALSTVDNDALPAFIEEARRMGYKILPPDVNLSGTGFALGDTGLDIRYGLDSIKGVGPAAVATIMANQPYTSWEDFTERSGANSGVVKTLVHVGALDSLAPNRRWLEKVLEHEAIPGAEKCANRTETSHPVVWLPTPERGQEASTEVTEWELPCSYQWGSEPDVEGRTGKKMKRKPPPKKCTRACRQYSPAAPPDLDDVAPYTSVEIREIEQEMLGTYLSSTPFDRIPAEDMEQFATGDDVMSGPEGTYMVAAVIQGWRFAKNRDDMGFLALSTPRGSLSTVVFPKMYERFGTQFTKNALIYIIVSKNDRGCALDSFIPID